MRLTVRECGEERVPATHHGVSPTRRHPRGRAFGIQRGTPCRLRSFPLQTESRERSDRRRWRRPFDAPAATWPPLALRRRGAAGRAGRGTHADDVLPWRRRRLFAASLHSPRG